MDTSNQFVLFVNRELGKLMLNPKCYRFSTLDRARMWLQEIRLAGYDGYIYRPVVKKQMIRTHERIEN